MSFDLRELDAEVNAYLDVHDNEMRFLFRAIDHALRGDFRWLKHSCLRSPNLKSIHLWKQGAAKWLTRWKWREPELRQERLKWKNL